MKKNNDALRPDSRCRMVLAAAVLATAAAASGAHAAPFTLTFGDPDAATTTVLYSLVSATQPSYSLSAQIVFDLTAITASAATFAVTVTNTTAPNTPNKNRLVSFGIDDINPSITGTSITNDTTEATWKSFVDMNFPGGFGTLELCAIGNKNAQNCSGGGNGGLGEGETDSFTWILYGTFGAAPTISFTSPIPIRFQSIDPSLWGDDSITFDALSPQVPPVMPPGEPPVAQPPVAQPPTSEPPVAPPSEEPLRVPEPGSAMLVGLGLLGAALARRRQSRRT
jgi:hypothetical protein